MKDTLVTLIWIILFVLIVLMLAMPGSRAVYVELNLAMPYLIGFIKVGIMGTMGELLGGKVVTGKWRLSGVRIGERALVWAVLGTSFVVVFPMFSFGVEGAQKAGLIGFSNVPLMTSLIKSTFMNVVFGFPMMCFHRLTDTAIDNGGLFRKWNIPNTFRSIDWDNMFKVVGVAVFWFWIPAQTFTFMLPPEFRVMSAALLAIALGLIMGFSKKLSLKKAQS